MDDGAIARIKSAFIRPPRWWAVDNAARPRTSHDIFLADFECSRGCPPSHRQWRARRGANGGDAESGDATYIAHALGIVAKARGMTKVAKAVGVSRVAILANLLGVPQSLPAPCQHP